METIDQRMSAAMRLHQAGRLGDAEAVYRAILQDQPEHADALHLMGLLAHQAGRHEEAIEFIRRALAGKADPIFHSNLAGAYLALGRSSEAVASCQEAVRLEPSNAENRNNLGVALRRLGKTDQAAACFRDAIRLAPHHADARSNLGGVLQRQGRLAESMSVLEETVRLFPSHARAHSNLGAVLIEMGYHDVAIQHFREAVRLRPNFTEAINYIGVVMRDIGQNEEAIRWFREVLRIDPKHSTARNTLAHTLETMGRIPEAIAELEEGLRHEPENAKALGSLGRFVATGDYSFHDEQLPLLEKLTARGDLPAEDVGQLHMALAWTFDKRGEYQRAFSHCQRCKELRKEEDRRRGEVFEPEAHRKYIERIIATFTPEWFERVRSFGNDSDRPVFVVGMMRSGTTLAEQVLASHPEVAGAGELRDVERMFLTLPGRLGLNVDPLEAMGLLDAAMTRRLAEEHRHVLGQIGGRARRVVDKQPFNFLRLGFIAMLFPRAKIIHCRRDPVDTCMSCYFQNFESPLPFTLDLGHLGVYYREYQRLMEHWKRVLPLPIFELNYEELTARQEEVSRRMVEFCGLEWDERCLRFNETQRVVRTASAMQVRQAMYRTSVGRWKRYEAQIPPLHEELGRNVSGALKTE
jgi:tetratricopeptide (TPR) repeat protein